MIFFLFFSTRNTPPALPDFVGLCERERERKEEKNPKSRCHQVASAGRLHRASGAAWLSAVIPNRAFSSIPNSPLLCSTQPTEREVSEQKNLHHLLLHLVHANHNRGFRVLNRIHDKEERIALCSSPEHNDPCRHCPSFRSQASLSRLLFVLVGFLHCVSIRNRVLSNASTRERE